MVKVLEDFLPQWQIGGNCFVPLWSLHMVKVLEDFFCLHGRVHMVISARGLF